MTTITALHIVRDGQPLTAIQSGLPNQNDWLTTAELLSIARQIHERAIDGQRIAAEPPRHPATPGYLEYPSFDESASFEADPQGWPKSMTEVTHD